MELPDNLTVFKLRAKAASGPDRFGVGVSQIAVRLPVIVQPALPRFVRPGARRALCAATKEALECTAFVNDDGSLAVVVLNRGEVALPFVLDIANHRWRVELPPRAITTLLH